MDGGAWWATVHGVTKSQTGLSDFTTGYVRKQRMEEDDEIQGRLYEDASPRQMCLELLLFLDGEQSTSHKPPERWNETREDNINNQGERGFPGGSVVKTLPANAGNRGLIPDLGRSHMPQNS